MRAGRLDRRIDLQRAAEGQSASGATTESWQPIASRVAASYSPVRGDERNAAPQYVAREQVEFWIRWASDIADLNPKDQVIYPALVEGLSPEDKATEGRVYDIISAHEIGRREWWKITAARRADV